MRLLLKFIKRPEHKRFARKIFDISLDIREIAQASITGNNSRFPHCREDECNCARLKD